MLKNWEHGSVQCSYHFKTTQNSVPSDSESSLGRGELDTPCEEIEDYEDCPDDDAIISLLRLVRAEFLARESTGYPEPLSTSPFTPGPVTWGGVTGGVFLSNTCPLDNFLAILWSTFLCHPPVRQMFAEDSSAVSACLCQAVNLINEGKDAEAKVLWERF